MSFVAQFVRADTVRTTSGRMPWLSRIQMHFHYLSMKILRRPLLSAHIAMILACVSVLVLTTFITSVRYLQDPDKALVPWRQYCSEQPWFVRADVEHLAPVNFLVGVITVDEKFERRQVIRSTYASLTTPRHPETGQPLGNVQVKFVLGRPRKEYAERIALEMELYNDIVVLDIKETQWSRKTFEFLRWAAENATVPVLVPHTSQSHPYMVNGTPYEVRWKLVDYVLKADDDAFIVLDELERRLRAAPRTMAHWGYKVADWFMSGEVYALSQDLVQYIAHSPDIAASASRKEDEQLARWVATHPRHADLQWLSERCWVYDHPRASTPYAHGFLFPDHVESIKEEALHGLSAKELARRGGLTKALSYSTTTKWNTPYTPPRPDLTVEEGVEALIEGGGRWAHSWYRTTRDPDTPRYVSLYDFILPSDDQRLGPKLNASGEAAGPATYDPSTGLAVYAEPVSHPAAARGPNINEAWGPNLFAHEDQLRRERYLNYTVGGTVVVHYLKHDAWFYETALALLGHRPLWHRGSAANEWRMYGSPLVQPFSSTHRHIVQDAPRTHL
ncbi:hypothetical protein MEQU1_001060 [Malassezia equina]|uniref:Uncharacterized protein n=1 Tax=Malassezia equina TaxID=1381935 RepID=A0AAF0J2V8_9BASI|nr:hypothetical protein MEQU1_001060 [Malassezia equina]